MLDGFSSNYNNKEKNIAYNDIYIDSAGNLSVCSNQNSIVENVYHSILLLLGEYDFDVDIGVNWQEYLTTNPIQYKAIKLSLTKTISAVDGVININTINILYDSKQRTLSFSIDIQTENNQEIILLQNQNNQWKIINE